MIEWLFTLRLFLALWLMPAKYLEQVSIWRQEGSANHLAIEFTYVIRHTGHVIECGASVPVGRFTLLRAAWHASKEWQRTAQVARRKLMNEKELLEFAKELALALADEVAFAGDDAAEQSLDLLEKARKELALEKEFEEIDTLRMQAYKQ